MADPILDQLINPGDPAPADPAPADPSAPTGVTLDQAEYDRLKAMADGFEQAKPLLDDLRAGRFSAAPAPAPPPPPPAPNNEGNADDQFWQSPSQATDKLVKKRIQEEVTPYALQMASQLGTLCVNNFRASKMSDPFFAGAAPHFDREMGRIDKSWLGQMTPQKQVEVLETGWNAATGAYVREYQAKNPPRPTPPPNIGGGGSAGGGGGGKRSLAEIDPGTYKMAVSQGWSQEKMDKFAEELLKELE